MRNKELKKLIGTNKGIVDVVDRSGELSSPNISHLFRVFNSPDSKSNIQSSVVQLYRPL